jgi:integrase
MITWLTVVRELALLNPDAAIRLLRKALAAPETALEVSSRGDLRRGKLPRHTGWSGWAVALDLRDVLRTVKAAEGPYRPLYAVLYGAGVEISAALACTERDVDMRSRELRAPGTKTHSRDRVVRVADWAWPHLLGHVTKLLPGERLFAGLDRWKVGEHHTALLKRLELPHHRLHDARHFYAVRAIRAGTPYELVARQLGHADVAMVAKVY